MTTRQKRGAAVAGPDEIRPIGRLAAGLAFVATIAASGADAAPVTGPPETVAPGVMASWQAEEQGDPKSYRIGALQMTLSTRTLPDDMKAPLLTVTDGAGRAFEIQGADTSFGAAQADFGVLALDRAAPVGQLLVRSFTGGAHCCFTYQLATSTAQGWSVAEIGAWDASPMPEPKDVDGDGRPELVGGDEAFGYVFAPYAGSFYPPQVQEVRNGKLIDVSTEARYRKVFDDLLPELKGECAKRYNGACAAYVATAIRAGQGEAAWRFMLAHVDPEGDWLPTGCRVRLVKGECPKGQERTFTAFPEALAWFLGENGYAVPAAAAASRRQ